MSPAATAKNGLTWAWIAQTVCFTLLFHGKSRKGQELEDRFGDSLERMTAVTDRHSAYFALHFLNHQVCLAHLLRECQYLNELDKDQEWSKSVESLLQEAIHERNQRPTESLETKPWLARLDKLIDENLSKLSEKFTTFKMDCSNVGIIFSTSSKTRQYRRTTMLRNAA